MQENVTPVHKQWSYVFLALTHQYDHVYVYGSNEHF